MAEEKPLKEIVVEKEEAVFWMDRFGRWHNDGGPFEHKKIIDYFNSAIRRDENGYFLYQAWDETIEKVYFKHEDTPLFVVDVRMGEPMELVLNTRESVSLVPADLFVCQDQLYMARGDERLKFTDRVVMKLCTQIEFDGKRYAFVTEHGRREIPEYEPPLKHFK
ncbi:MAG: MFS transporter permease [Desulfatitalea sp.]|nr:DUF1285 domain-containing protein [Desulfatitalea sp.]NNK02196.1 MFS transporter permease [Desulfatitalea sp.]